MGLSRADAAKRKRERKAADKITGDGLIIAPNDAQRCDICGTPKASLYDIGDCRLICLDDLPFEYRHGVKARRIMKYIVIGRNAIMERRNQHSEGKPNGQSCIYQGK